FFANSKLNRSFTTVKHMFACLWVGLWCLLPLQEIMAQNAIQGIVFDKHTQQRVAKVYVYNTANDAGGYNNLRGEFDIPANPGDVLIAAAKGYIPDTLVVG